MSVLACRPYTSQSSLKPKQSISTETELSRETKKKRTKTEHGGTEQLPTELSFHPARENLLLHLTDGGRK